MSSGYNSNNVILFDTAQTLAASASGTVLSKTFKISDGDALDFVADVLPSSVTGTATVKLQTSQDGTNWVTSKTVALSGSTLATIKLLDTDSGDWTYLPLRPIGRFIVDTTTATGSVTSIFITRRE